MLSSKGDSVQAVAQYRRAIAIDESVYGVEHPEVAADLVNLGTLLKESGHPDEGSSALHRGLAIYEKAFGPASRQAAQVRSELQ